MDIHTYIHKYVSTYVDLYVIIIHTYVLHSHISLYNYYNNYIIYVHACIHVHTCYFIQELFYRFSPEHLGMNASSLLAWLVAEVLLIWLSFFLARVTSQLSWLDILAYCSYKYVRCVCVSHDIYI